MAGGVGRAAPAHLDREPVALPDDGALDRVGPCVVGDREEEGDGASLVDGLSFAQSYAFLDDWVLGALDEVGVHARFVPLNDIASSGAMPKLSFKVG